MTALGRSVLSDQSNGPGWWLASDGKWYPPAPQAPMSTEPPPAGAPPPYGTEPTDGFPKQAWRKYRSWPLWVQIVIGIAVLSILAAPFTSSEDEPQTVASEDTTTTTTQVEDDETTTTEPETTTTEEPTTTTAPPPPTTVDPFAGETVSQGNARQKAAEYLDYTSFSRSGLIEQLKFEGFTQDDAAYGVDALNVDWNEQAAKKAAEYLDYTSFSRSGLIEQLVFEGFTQAQAEYGASTTGL